MSSYPKRSVYLAGTITGLDHDGARFGWRKDFVNIIEKMGLDHIHCFSPMRGKEFLKNHGVLTSGEGYPEHPMATDAGVTTRDINDVRFCDVLVGCFLESQGNPSLGTGIEYGAAWILQKPVVAIGPESDPNIRHLMMRRIAGYRLDTLEDAAAIVGYLLTPGL